MKKITFFLILIAFTFASSITVIAQKSDLSGIWKLDRTKSTVSEYFPTLLKINVLVKGDSLLTERTYDTGDGQEYPFTENVPLNGKESAITIYDMPRKSKALWAETEGVLNLESTTTASGSNGPEDFNSKETWKVDSAARTLTISFKNTSSAGQTDGALIFNKAE